MKLRELQSAHEKSVVESFGSYLNEHGITLKVIKRPDPPDAIVNIDDEECWIEITDAFQSDELAKSITTYAADDKPHQPYKSSVICEPDELACVKVREVILNKYHKQSMKNSLNQYGQGILLVGVYTPLTSPEEIIEQLGDSILAEIASMTKIFKSIYLYRNAAPTGHKFLRLL